MVLLLGLDTGGTYTDAVLFDEGAADPVLSKAKALTSRPDLSIGIGEALASVLAGTRGEAISLVSLSTTLATNALVEGQGGSVALVFIGFEPEDAARGGLADALAGDPLIMIAGGFETSGAIQAPLDRAALEAALKTLHPKVEAVAIVSRFGSRNPSQEKEARSIVYAATGLPVTCGYELSSKLNGPKRAVTCVLNARLIGLITATEAQMAQYGITAPLMLVRGDGALVSAEFARRRPIETILSGPAASVVGAGTLTGEKDALVSDIGGTTTDIAIISNGCPRLNETGARVGGFSTMVEAVDIETIGLGGDSEVALDVTGIDAKLRLGPQRVLPVCLLASFHPELVLASLTAQLARNPPSDLDGRFAVLVGGHEADTPMIAALAKGPQPLEALLKTRPDRIQLDRLRKQGVVRLSAFTPTDTAHVLGLHEGWDTTASDTAARLFARLRDGRGQPAFPTTQALCRAVVDTLNRLSAHALLDAAFRSDDLGEITAPVRDLLDQALSGKGKITRLSIGLSQPLIGLGASAPTYYPGIAQRLGTTAHIPEHADVANAIGAVSGRITIRKTLTVSAIEGGGYRAHLPDGPQDFANAQEAIETAKAQAEQLAEGLAREAGTDTPSISLKISERRAEIEGKSVLIEASVTAEASGRPSLDRMGRRA